MENVNFTLNLFIEYLQIEKIIQNIQLRVISMILANF